MSTLQQQTKKRRRTEFKPFSQNGNHSSHSSPSSHSLQPNVASNNSHQSQPLHPHHLQSPRPNIPCRPTTYRGNNTQLNNNMERPDDLEPTTPNQLDGALNPIPFPDKMMDRLTPSRNRPTTPTIRRNCNPLFLRRISGGTSSSEDSPCYNRQRRLGVRHNHNSPNSNNNNNTGRQVTYLVGTPRMSRIPNTQHEVNVKTVLMEVTRDLENFDDTTRPSSPRPTGEFQNCVEHNKQMQVWDDWAVLANTDMDLPVASLSFKRIESENIMMMKPKALEKLIDDDSEMELE